MYGAWLTIVLYCRVWENQSRGVCHANYSTGFIQGFRFLFFPIHFPPYFCAGKPAQGNYFLTSTVTPDSPIFSSVHFAFSVSFAT